MSKRISWDEYFISIAEKASMRSTCPKAAVGAIVVKDNQIIGTGYNGAPSGLPHCSDIGCIEINGHCSNVIHAEINAIIHAQKNNNVNGAILYCTYKPCFECCKIIINVGISKVKYRNNYVDNRFKKTKYSNQNEYFKEVGITMEKI